jgi:hypothetical protein
VPTRYFLGGIVITVFPDEATPIGGTFSGVQRGQVPRFVTSDAPRVEIVKQPHVGRE